MEIVGQPAPERGQEPVTDVRVITHQYLRAMGIPLLRGRLFNENDAADATNRVIINETMARRHWPGEASACRSTGMTARTRSSAWSVM
jgi:hypothetical protein